jgi:predicted DNA-binding transcriptional regulator YafY
LRKSAGTGPIALAALALCGCAEAPETDPIAQKTMIGISERMVLACMGGAPAWVTRPAQATKIWTYRSGVTTTDSPPWAIGTNFSLLAGDAHCDVRIVMTNAHVSQVAYAMANGRALPSGRQCSFPVWTCAALAGSQ